MLTADAIPNAWELVRLDTDTHTVATDSEPNCQLQLYNREPTKVIGTLKLVPIAERNVRDVTAVETGVQD